MMSLEKQLIDIYGETRGRQVFMTVSPGILADFMKMLKSAPPDKIVTEEYRMEDGTGSVFMKGKKKHDGSVEIL